jgi:Septum formation
MRRAWRVALVGAALAVLAAGCAKPTGTDNDLTNAWPAFDKAVTPTPKVGACYSDKLDTTWYADDFSGAVDCSGSHQTETVFVGTFSGTEAGRSSPPLAGTPSRAEAYGQCMKAANDYLGDDWHNAKVVLGLVLPSDKAWTGGARWYRCDVVAFDDFGLETVRGVGSVKGGLQGSRALAITCVTITADGSRRVTGEKDTPCDQPHNAEFAGLYTAPARDWPDRDTESKLANDGCRGVWARFLGLGGNGSSGSNYVGWWARGFDEDQWKLGDRTEICYVVALDGNNLSAPKVVGSMKGIRDGKPRQG